MFSRMLRSGTPQSFNWMMQSHLFHQSTPVSIKDAKDAAGIIFLSIFLIIFKCSIVHFEICLIGKGIFSSSGL